MQDLDLDLTLFAEAVEFGDDRLDGTGDVGLQHQTQFLHFPFLSPFEQVFQGELVLCLVGSRFRLAGLHDGAGFLFGSADLEDVAGGRNFGQPHDLDRCGRSGFMDLLPFVIEHRADLTVSISCQDHAAHLQCAVLHQQRGKHALGAVDFCFDHGTENPAFGVCFDLHGICGQEHRFHQIFDPLPLFGGNRHDHGVTVPFIRDQSVVCKLFLDQVRVGIGAVDLVHGNDDRHPGGFCVSDGFLGLGHHTVIGGYHQDHDIGTLRTAGAHGAEGGMSRCVEEGDGFALVFHLVSTDVLGDPAGLSGCYITVPDRVQQGGFPVVYVAEDRHDRRTHGQTARVFLVNDLPPERYLSVIFFDFLLFLFFRYGFKSDLACDDRGGIKVDGLVDVCHNAVHHEDLDDLNTGRAQQFCQVAHRYRKRYFNFLRSTHYVSLLSNRVFLPVGRVSADTAGCHGKLIPNSISFIYFFQSPDKSCRQLYYSVCIDSICAVSASISC